MKTLEMTLIIILYLLLGVCFTAHGFYTEGDDVPFTWSDVGIAIMSILLWLPWTVGYLIVHLYRLIKSKIKKK